MPTKSMAQCMPTARMAIINPGCVEREEQLEERDQQGLSNTPGFLRSRQRPLLLQEASVLGLHLAEVSSQLKGSGLTQGPCAALAAGLPQLDEEALPVLRNSQLQVPLSLLQLHQGGVQGPEVVHRDLQG